MKVSRIASIQVGHPRLVEHGKTSVLTAIFKDPVTGPVHLGALGLAGDGQADAEHHGGVNQAVYAYPREHYTHWADRLPERIHEPGLFGENLTIEGWLETDVHPGDVFRMGTARLEVTTPRSPCFKLGLRTGDDGIIAPFLASGRLGFYLRVVEEGVVAAGDPIERLSTPSHGLTLAEFIAALFAIPVPPDLVDRALALPQLSPSHRARLEARLASSA
jgi:MOSC domain-containing protein YiiM